MTILLVEMWTDRLKGITELVTEAGLEHIIVRPFQGDKLTGGQYGSIIISGGAPNVSEIDKHPFLYDVVSFVRQAVDSNTPVLGICLGHQILAHAIGGRVIAAQKPEIGFKQIYHNSSELLDGVQNPLIAFQYHSDEVIALPDTAQQYALSRDCSIQAFKVAGRPCWGVQFHPEISHAWGRQILLSRSQALAQRGIDAAQLVRYADQYYKEQEAFKVIRNFLARIS